MTAWMNYVKQYAKDTTEKGIPSGKSYRNILSPIDEVSKEIKVIIELGRLFIFWEKFQYYLLYNIILLIWCILSYIQSMDRWHSAETYRAGGVLAIVGMGEGVQEEV